MARADACAVEGVVVKVLPKMLYRVELANGHRLLAYGAAKAGLAPLAVGDKVKLEMSLYDLSEGRIIGDTKNS